MSRAVRPVGRPLGEFSQALLSAAARGPAPMAELAQRAQVGYDVARFKVPALARAGALVALNDDRPRVYALAPQYENSDSLVMLSRSFWELGPSGEDVMEGAA